MEILLGNDEKPFKFLIFLITAKYYFYGLPKIALTAMWVTCNETCFGITLEVLLAHFLSYRTSSPVNFDTRHVSNVNQIIDIMITKQYREHTATHFY